MISKKENKNLDKLVKMAINGSDNAFKQIITLKCESILFSAMNILGDYKLAEEAARKTVSEIYTGINKLTNPSSFNVWLYKIVIDQCHIMKNEISKQENINVGNLYPDVNEGHLNKLVGATI